MAAPLIKSLQTVVNALKPSNSVKYFSCGQALYAKKRYRRRPVGKSHEMKRSDGQFAHQYEILVTQHGLRYYPGENVGIDRRNRLYALCDGEVMVSCETLSPYPDSPLYRHIKRGYVVKKKFVNLIPAPLHGKFKLVSELPLEFSHVQKAMSIIFYSNNEFKEMDELVCSRSGHFPKSSLPPILDVEKLESPVPADDPYRANFIKPACLDETTLLGYDPEIRKFTNYLMFNDKQVAEDLLDSTFIRIKQIQLKKHQQATAEEKHDIEIDPRVILKQAILNCRPILVLKSIAKGGVMYRVPIYCNEKRSFRMGCDYIIKSVREKRKTNTPFYVRLCTEILSAYKNEGRAIQKKQALHKECEANRAYAHYRWSRG